MYYVNVSRQQIEDLRPAIDLLMQIWGEDLDKNSLFLYGMVEDSSPVLASMDDVVGGKVSSGVVAIPLDSDALYFLTGSGYALKKESFLYASGGELRTANFSEVDQEPVVTLSSFSKLALSSSNAWMDRYFKLENPEDLSSAHGEVDRTEPATDLLEDHDHGGLQSEEPEVVKASSAGKIIKVWTESNIEDWSVEELYKLLHDLAESNADGPDSQFFLWSASDMSGYLIQTTGGVGSAIRFIASKLNLDPSDVAAEGTELTGRELASTIENILGS